MEIDQFSRTRLLFGDEALNRFQQSRIAVIGLGGVGCYAAEALARSGIGKMLIVDFDTISATNINRQLPALHSTIGRAKTEVMKERLLDINPNLKLRTNNSFCNQESRDEILVDIDIVVDAIDSLNPKVGLLENCYQKGLEVISVMGAGSRFDPSQIREADISKTTNCPLARKVRKYLGRRGIRKGIPVIYSIELPVAQFPADAGTEQEWQGTHGRMRGTLGSVVYMPAIMGMWAASYVLRRLGGRVK